LLSSMGLGAAAAEFMASLLLIALLVFAVIFIVRRLRGAGRQPAFQGAGSHHASPMQRQGHVPQPQSATLSRRAAPAAAAAHPAVASTAAPAVQDESWHIPAGFDTQQFLQHAKQHFIDLQDAWDKNDLVRMHEFMTDELLDAVKASVAAREPGGKTDVVLLNAQLLGVEKVAEGNLASVRFSGMLRDDSGPEAYRFEEVWNFLKPVQGGWVLAGIQQIPVQYES
jgi:predicted lipid-binding transport protein (Tim44 family)